MVAVAVLVLVVVVVVVLLNSLNNYQIYSLSKVSPYGAITSPYEVESQQTSRGGGRGGKGKGDINTMVTNVE